MNAATKARQHTGVGHSPSRNRCAQATWHAVTVSLSIGVYFGARLIEWRHGPVAEQAGCRLLLRARLSGTRKEKQPAQEGIGFVRSSTGMIPYGCRPRPRGAEAQRHRGSGLKAQAKGSASYMSADEESIALVVWLARQSVVVAGEPKQRGAHLKGISPRRQSFSVFTHKIYLLYFSSCAYLNLPNIHDTAAPRTYQPHPYPYPVSCGTFQPLGHPGQNWGPGQLRWRGPRPHSQPPPPPLRPRSCGSPSSLRARWA